MQQVYCRICANIIHTAFHSDRGETCGKGCAKELEWRQQLAAANSAYYPRKKTRYVRIAELDPVEELDSLIEDLKAVPDLVINRYLIPKETYHIFASNPPPIGPDFPIATLEGEWDTMPCGPGARVFGLLGVQAFLQELRIPSFVVTRKFKRSKVRAALKKL
jgi:hypothetical protein